MNFTEKTEKNQMCVDITKSKSRSTTMVGGTGPQHCHLLNVDSTRRFEPIVYMGSMTCCNMIE